MRASVVIATANRATLLPGLLACLEAQSVLDFEVVIVDDGSRDETWDVLRRFETPLPLLVLHLAATDGPSIPRNTGASRARTDVLLFTDDDCLPSADWVEGVLAAHGAGPAVVRGVVRPSDEPHGPWDRSIEVGEGSPWFETSNLSLPRSVFLQVGGFPVLDLVGTGLSGRGFGEDTVLGRRAAAVAPVRWAVNGEVRHCWLPGTFATHLDGQRRMVAFPGLIGEVPELRDQLLHGIFLTRRGLRFWLALMGVALAGGSRRAGPLLMGVPWVSSAWLGQLLVADGVGAAALVRGSVREGVLVL
jgi:glycosyltransferase involved in cell wall biosynthesis